MRSLSVQHLLSICLIIFLRLASCDAPHKELLPLWRCSGEYLDSLLMLALESSGQDVSTSAAAWTLHVVLIHDWWEKRLHCLLTHHRLLQKTWIDRVKSKPLPECVGAAVRVMLRRFSPWRHLLEFPYWFNVCFPCFHWSEEEVNAALRDEEAQRTDVEVVACSVADTYADVHLQTPPRKRLRPDPGVISPRTETRYFRLSSDDPAGASEPLVPDDSPETKKFKLWYQREVFVSDEENVPDIPSPCDVSRPSLPSSSSALLPSSGHDDPCVTDKNSKQYKWGACPVHGCARSPHVFPSTCAPERRGKAFLRLGRFVHETFVFLGSICSLILMCLVWLMLLLRLMMMMMMMLMMMMMMVLVMMMIQSQSEDLQQMVEVLRRKA